MGIAERKQREKREMRQLILDAAMKRFVREGFEKTSVRQIAKDIEYSVGAMYVHFKNKNEIFYALHVEFFNMLHSKFNEASIEDPLQRLRWLGQKYMEFGFENPEAYHLMFVAQSPMETIEDQESWYCAKRTFDVLVQTVDQCVKEGYFPNKDVMQLTMMTYGLSHGILSLKLYRDMKMFPEEERQRLIHSTLDYILELLQKP